MTNRKNGKRIVVRSSGNVFADLGLPNAEERKTKVRLAFEINQIIENRKLSQTEAARRLKINQPKISALSNYRIDGFSVERLMNFLDGSRPGRGRFVMPLLQTGNQKERARILV